MAQGRMLLKKISTSKPVNDLTDDLSRLLFSWAIAHLDVEGRMHGDPCVFRSTVAPRLSHVTDEVVERCFAEWQEHGLVARYEAKGDWWLQFLGFLDNQPGLRAAREAPSFVPAPTPEQLRTYSGVTPAKVGPMEVKGREGKDAPRSNSGPDSRSWVISWYRAFTGRTAQPVEPDADAFALGAKAWKRAPPETLLASVPPYFEQDFWFTRPKRGTKPEYSFRNYCSHLEDILSSMSANGSAKRVEKVKVLRCPDGHPYLEQMGMCMECGWKPEEAGDGPDFG